MGLFLALLSQVLSLCSSNELRNNKEGQIATYDFSFLSSSPSEMLHGNAYNELMMYSSHQVLIYFCISNKDQLPVPLQKEKTDRLDIHISICLIFCRRLKIPFHKPPPVRYVQKLSKHFLISILHSLFAFKRNGLTLPLVIFLISSAFGNHLS